MTQTPVVQAPVVQDDSSQPVKIEVDVFGEASKAKGLWRKIQSKNFIVTGDADPTGSVQTFV